MSTRYTDHYTYSYQLYIKKINNKNIKDMKQGIHPENYRTVVFKDMSNGDMFLSRSTCKTNDTVEFEARLIL